MSKEKRHARALVKPWVPSEWREGANSCRDAKTVIKLCSWRKHRQLVQIKKSNERTSESDPARCCTEHRRSCWSFLERDVHYERLEGLSLEVRRIWECREVILIMREDKEGATGIYTRGLGWTSRLTTLGSIPSAIEVACHAFMHAHEVRKGLSSRQENWVQM